MQMYYRVCHHLLLEQQEGCGQIGVTEQILFHGRREPAQAISASINPKSRDIPHLSPSTNSTQSRWAIPTTTISYAIWVAA